MTNEEVNKKQITLQTMAFFAYSSILTFVDRFEASGIEELMSYDDLNVMFSREVQKHVEGYLNAILEKNSNSLQELEDFAKKQDILRINTPKLLY